MKMATGRSPGFTLIELMIVLSIAALLLATALPAYQEQVRKTKRTLAKRALLELRGRQEQFFVNHKQYASSLTALGYAASPFAINSDGNPVASTASNRVYSIGMTAVSAMVFTLVATPQLAQAKDTRCGTLTLTHLGVKSAARGSASTCW